MLVRPAHPPALQELALQEYRGPPCIHDVHLDSVQPAVGRVRDPPGVERAAAAAAAGLLLPGALVLGADFRVPPVRLSFLLFITLSERRDLVLTLSFCSKWPWWKALLSSAVFGAACAGVEILLVLTLRVRILLLLNKFSAWLTHASQDPYSRGVTWPVILIGVIATILLVAGLVPVYCEIWKRKGKVVGISTSEVPS